MNRTLSVAVVALLLAACAKPTEEDSESAGGAASVAALQAGIYDGDGAVVRVTDLENGNRLFDFAHSFQKQAPGAPVARDIVKGAVEVAKGKTPKLVADELYPCSATLGVSGGKLVADADCRGVTGKIKLPLSPRATDALKGTYAGAGGSVTLGRNTVDGLDVAIDGMPEPTKGQWVYGGAAYSADFGSCHVAVIVRSADGALALDTRPTAKAIDIDAKGTGCKIKSGRYTAR